MLPLPSPPTDNLYKFIAIAGLLMAGVGFVLPHFVEQDRQEMILKRRVEYQDRKMNTVLKFAEIVLKEDIKDDAKRQRVLDNIGQSLSPGIEQEKAEYLREMSERMAAYDRQLGWLLAAKILGPLVTLIGFGLWWKRVQKHQDEILRDDVEKRRSDAKERQKKAH